MKQLLRIVFVLLASISAFSQTEQNTGSNIVNQHTEKHVVIPGTKLSIIPPEEFEVATNFTGLEKKDVSVIQIYDLVGGNFLKNASIFSKQTFEDKGAKVFDYQEITINGFAAKFIHMQGNPEVKGYSLVFGDTTFSAMIMALYPAEDTQTGLQIKKALFSSIYEKDKPIDPLEAAFFELDDSKTKFKYASSAANMFIYSADGIKKSNYKDESMLIVMPIPTDSEMTPKNVSDQMIDGLKGNGLTNVKVISTSEEKLNDYPAYQIQVEGVMNGYASTVLVQTVTHGENTVVIEGFSKEKSAAVIEDFKALIATIKMK
ncbi:hypothetical protein [Aquimarina sp. AU474]|uniref:hypothetical protein n=1 Tax=Aquimarina sp. AU474 TaxID=2108529 RepID=UPI000D68B7C5|nr:hypothetical protein [Aquimarina sp. AU474]